MIKFNGKDPFGTYLMQREEDLDKMIEELKSCPVGNKWEAQRIAHFYDLEWLEDWEIAKINEALGWKAFE